MRAYEFIDLLDDRIKPGTERITLQMLNKLKRDRNRERELAKRAEFAAIIYGDDERRAEQEERRLDLERQKLELEQERFALEQERAELAQQIDDAEVSEAERERLRTMASRTIATKKNRSS